jgi:hypothetical protein
MCFLRQLLDDEEIYDDHKLSKKQTPEQREQWEANI